MAPHEHGSEVRYAKARDANEGAIVDALRAVGASVTRLSDAGVTDLLVGFRRETYLLEVKLPLGPRGGMTESRGHEGGRGDLTKAQVEWWSTWRGRAPAIVRDAAEALRAIGAETT